MVWGQAGYYKFVIKLSIIKVHSSHVSYKCEMVWNKSKSSD